MGLIPGTARVGPAIRVRYRPDLIIPCIEAAADEVPTSHLREFTKKCKES